MLNNFLFGEKKKEQPKKQNQNKQKPLPNQTTSFEKNDTQTRKSSEPKVNSNKKKH